MSKLIASIDVGLSIGADIIEWLNTFSQSFSPLPFTKMKECWNLKLSIDQAPL